MAQLLGRALVVLSMRARRATAIVILLVGMSGGSAAKAAFSGTNGLLAAQPAHGPGIVLIDPRTGHARLICRARSQCGRPTSPRWAPDGRQIVTVDSATGRVDVVTSTGACVVCASDRPLVGLHAQSAAFVGRRAALGNDADLLVGSDGAQPELWTVAFATPQARPLEAGGATTVDTSSSDTLATSWRGWVYLGRSGVTRWTRGGEPAVDGHGNHVAFVRHGWVWLLPLNNGNGERRLVRGSQPAFSPDGRELALIGRGGHVFILTLRTMRTRQVGQVGARSLDWGPAASAKNACDPPAGEWLATAGHSLLWQRTTGASPDEALTVWGCDQTTRVPRKLLTGYPNYDYFIIPHVVLGGRSGRYAAIESHSGNRYFGGPDVVQVFDIRTGRLLDTSPELCLGFNGYSGCAVVDSLQVNDDGFAAWHQATPPGTQPLSPEEVLAADDDGVRVLDSAPPGEAPTLTNVTLGSTSVSWQDGGVPQSAALR